MPAYRYGVNYRDLATYLQTTTSYDTAVELIPVLQGYTGADPDVKGRILLSVAALPESATWWDGLSAITRVLKADNPRFLEGLFTEWVLEEV